MSLSQIIKLSKADKKEMSAISFNIPLVLKKQLKKLAKENDITINAFLVAMIDSVLNGELKEKNNMKIVEKLEKLKLQEKQFLEYQLKLEEQFEDDMKNALKEDVLSLSQKEINELNMETGKIIKEQAIVAQELKDLRYMIKLLT